MAGTTPALLPTLVEIQRQLAGEPADTRLTGALALVLEGLGCHHGAIYLLDGSGDLRIAAEQIGKDRHRPPTTQRRLALAAEGLLTSAMELSAERAQDPPSAPPFISRTAPGELVALLSHRQGPTGALAILGSSRRRFSAEQVAFVEAAANAITHCLDAPTLSDAARTRHQELEEWNRMAGLGLLTASVSHELRGPVTALALQLEEQRRLLQDAENRAGEASSMLVSELLELAADLDTALTRVRATVEQLARLSSQDSRPVPVDLTEVVRDALEVARPYLRRRGIRLSEHLDQPARAMGRRDHLGQVLLNLVFNAADACEQIPQTEHTLHISVYSDEDRAVLQVDDSGPGIPQNAIRTIFTPFYTTKQRGKGTGLGLKICADVVTAHGGHIEVANRPQGGASFRVLLPLEGSRSSRPPSQTLRPTPGARTRILVIDDDPVFLRAVTRSLKEVSVDTALTASESEILFSRPDYRPELVLCDVHLPGLNGHDLHARIAARDPELAARFVFCTGGALAPEVAQYLRETGRPTLFKPLNLDDVREILDAAPASFHQARTLARADEGA